EVTLRTVPLKDWVGCLATFDSYEDAYGMCERLAPRIEALTGGRVGLRILSNLTDRRTVTVRGRVPYASLVRQQGVDGATVAQRIEEASVFAERCPYRAATHNKGIMNGMDAVLLAFGQDWRAVEAGAHAYAAKDGRYTAMARWRARDGFLHGEMTVPLAVGTVGGVAKVHPTVQVTRAVAQIKDASKLAAIVGAAGLAQNLAAIRALAAEGIQSGHMRLHARNVAAEAGAEPHEVAAVATAIADAKTVNLDGAKASLAELRAASNEPSNVVPLRAERVSVTGRFESLRGRYLDNILNMIREVTRQSGGDSLDGMTAYHFETGGKRLRALLPLMIAELLQEDPTKVLPFGAACEMLHNATLVHDDLQDGDEVRRGRPTIWKQYGIPQAINVGDAMFYYTLLLAQRLPVPVARREAASRRILVETLRVIDGQEREFQLKRPEAIDLSEYFQMVEGKTSGLFALPMAGAAEILGASADAVRGLTEAARHLGVLFQIQDDVLDIYGDKGRDMRGSDIAEGKRSVLVAHAFEHADAAERTWLLEVLDKDRTLTTPQDVLDVVTLFERTGSRVFALDELHRRREAAVMAVRDGGEGLVELIEGLCELFLAPIQSLLADPDAVVADLIGSHRIDPADQKFCFEMLPKVSRTFALSIDALPETLRSAVCVSYLLCRIVDTIEDEAVLAPDVRERLFDGFDALMSDDRADWRPFEAACREAALGGASADAELVAEAGAVFRAFRALPLGQRNGIRPHVLEMSSGMRAYCQRAYEEGKLRLRDLDDLERYCYFVAGTVGNLLTALFEPTVPVLPEPERSNIRSRAVSFGLGLQMVNIVKDVAVDFERGDIFVPVALAAEHGMALEDILTPQRRQEGLAVIRAICARAREHLQAAAEYTVLWPAPSGAAVRQFCAVPLALALASLAEVEAGQDTLRPGRVPKISRDMVAQLFQNVLGAVHDDEALAEVLRKCGEMPDEGGIVGEVHVPQRPPVPARAGVRAASTNYEESQSMTEQINPWRDIDGKFLVTGAAGHLGANLVRRLLADDREVRVLLRHSSNNEAMDGLNVERVYGDLRDAATLKKAVEGVAGVYHAAANVSTIEANDRLKKEIFECNVLGTRNLLAAAKEANVVRTVVTGSFSAVGYHLDDPSRPASEDVLIYPFDNKLPYARTKEMVEHECLKAVAEGQDVVIATSCAILGPADYKPSRMGRTLIDFTHGRLPAYIPGGFEFVAAEDLCEGHVLAMHRGRSGQKYVFSTEFLTMDDIMTLFEEVSGRRRPSIKLPPALMAGVVEVSSRIMNTFFPNKPQLITPAAIRILRQQRRADLTKARHELGYTPTTVRKAVHDAYADFARRGLVPAGPTIKTTTSADAAHGAQNPVRDGAKASDAEGKVA
ncbi:MAG: polyprenyl synthetase family protein, partial [Myxococcota bacterium]